MQTARAAQRRVLIVVAVLTLAFAGVFSAEAVGPQHTTSPVYWFADGSVVPGASANLLTTEVGATMNIQTVDLPAGTFTIWWVVFNHPEYCTHGTGGFGCGEGDLLIAGGDANVGGTVVHATGHLVGGSGKATFAAHLATNNTSEVLLGIGPGLTNPLGAEIHLVVRSHGPPVSGLVDQQIHTFGGGCIDAPSGTGTPGPNVCEDLQFAVFEQ